MEAVSLVTVQLMLNVPLVNLVLITIALVLKTKSSVITLVSLVTVVLLLNVLLVNLVLIMFVLPLLHPHHLEPLVLPVE